MPAAQAEVPNRIWGAAMIGKSVRQQHRGNARPDRRDDHDDRVVCAGCPFGIDDIYIALVTPAIVVPIEWLVRGTVRGGEVVQSNEA